MHKNGDRILAENYRPISDLSSDWESVRIKFLVLPSTGRTQSFSQQERSKREAQHGSIYQRFLGISLTVFS